MNDNPISPTFRRQACRARRVVGASAIVVALGVGVAAIPATTASAAATTLASTANTPAAPPSGGKPSGSKPTGNPPSGAGISGGTGPGGTGSSTAITGTGTYSLKGGTATKSGTTITASTKDESGVLVTKSGKLILKNVKVATTGVSSSSDNSSFYGLDSGVLASTGSSITETGGSVTTTGDGANAVFAYGSKSLVTIANTVIKASGHYAHGIMASGGGTIEAKDLTVTTSGASSAPIATDRGGGTITVTGGTFTSSGSNSPAIYSTGTIKVSNAKLNATGAEGVVVEGSNAVTLVNDKLTGGAKNGVMLYQSFSGDASGQAGKLTATGGSIVAKVGSLFYVTNDTATITLNHVRTSATSGILLAAEAASWGTAGANGGNATLIGTHQKLVGNVTVDKISTATIKLIKKSSLAGAVNTSNTAKSVTLSLDASSTWTVTANSYLTTLTGATISGSRVTNITGNGHTVYYKTADNPSLDGKTYTLAGGGTLTPGSLVKRVIRGRWRMTRINHDERATVALETIG